jgi:dolichol-phosphate mannosyltransferase
MRALVVIPTYNEIDSLEPIATGVLGAYGGDHTVELLVVDDGSPDGTGALAERLAADDGRVHVMHRTAKAGLGKAYLAGFGWGLDEGYDALCEMDADGSHDPQDLPRLLDALAGADVVIGSRYVPGGSVVDWPAHRRALSTAGNRYVQAVTGLPVADATAGFRAYRRAVIENIELATVRSDGYAFQVEMALRAYRLGFRLVEVPTVFTERRHGSSKISRRIVVEALARVAQWGLTGPRGPQPVHPRSVAATT